MLVTGWVLAVLVLAMWAYLVGSSGCTVIALLGEYAEQRVDAYVNVVGHDGYVREVSLPLMAAVVGGVMGVAVQSFVDLWTDPGSIPPGLGSVALTMASFLVAVALAIALPIWLRSTSARSEGLSFALRLHVLGERGDAAQIATYMADVRRAARKIARTHRRARRRAATAVLVYTALVASAYWLRQARVGEQWPLAVWLILLAPFAVTPAQLLRSVVERMAASRLDAYLVRASQLRSVAVEPARSGRSRRRSPITSFLVGLIVGLVALPRRRCPERN